MNTFICTGKLGRDPELYIAKNNDFITKLLIQVGNEKGDDDYFEAVIIGNGGKYASEHLKKGDRILIDGVLHNRYWQNKNGETRQKTEIKVKHYEFLERRVKNDEGEDNQRKETGDRELAADQL